jgi:mRNA-degrading endonuclease RelE of RelBE toxin-antitoxin system
VKDQERWPEVSGAKPMRGDLAGHWRIRTGDWRVLFQVRADVIIVRIDHRSRVYED